MSRRGSKAPRSSPAPAFNIGDYAQPRSSASFKLTDLNLSTEYPVSTNIRASGSASKPKRQSVSKIRSALSDISKSENQRRKTMEEGTRMLSTLLDDREIDDASFDHDKVRRMTADPLTIEDVLANLSVTMGSTPNKSVTSDMSFSFDKENVSVNNHSTFSSPLSAGLSSVKSKKRKSGGRRITAEAVDIALLMGDLKDDTVGTAYTSGNVEPSEASAILDSFVSRNSPEKPSSCPARRRSSKKHRASSVTREEHHAENNRRHTADPVDLHALLNNLDEESSQSAMVDRRATANFSHVLSLLNDEDDSDTGSMLGRRDSIDTQVLVGDIASLLSAEHASAPATSSTRSPAASVTGTEEEEENEKERGDRDSVDDAVSAVLSDLDQSFRSEASSRSRRETADPAGTLLGELDEDDHTVHSLESVNTLDLINDVGAMLGDVTAQSPSAASTTFTTGPFTSSLPLSPGPGSRHEDEGEVPRRRSRRLSIKSPTATMNTSVVADVEFDASQRSAMKALHAPGSVLKSCLSSRKKVPSSVRKVVFGSPDAMEFVRDSATNNFTPLTKERAKKLFVVEESVLPEMPENEETAENSRILDEWDRLSNASGFSSEDGDEEVAVPSPLSRRRRSSKLQRGLLSTSTSPSVAEDEPSRSLNTSVDNTCTVNLPPSLSALVREAERMMPATTATTTAAANTILAAASCVSTRSTEYGGVSNNSLDVSVISEHTQDLEVDLQSLLVSVAAAAAKTSGCAAVDDMEEAEYSASASPAGLADCNKSWADITGVSSPSAVSSDRSVGAILGFRPDPEAAGSSRDGSVSSSNHFNYELDFSHEVAAPAMARPSHISSSDESGMNWSISSAEPITVAPEDEEVQSDVHTDAAVDQPANREPEEVLTATAASMFSPLPSLEAHRRRRSSRGPTDRMSILATASAKSPAVEQVTVSIKEPEPTADNAAAAVSSMLNRLQRLNTEARENTILQSSTPSVKGSRASTEFMRQSLASSFHQQQREESAHRAPRPSKREHGVTALSAAADTLPAKKSRITEVVLPIYEEVIASATSAVKENEAPPSHNSNRPAAFAISVLAAAVEDEVDRAEAVLEVDSLCPILGEIEALKQKLEEIKRQKKDKLLVKSSAPVNTTTIPEEVEHVESAPIVPIPADVLAETIATVVHEPAAEELTNGGVTEATPVAVSTIHDTLMCFSGVQRELDDTHLTIDILNRLSYCRLLTYKASEIVVEVAVSAGVRVKVDFGLAYEETSLANTIYIEAIHVELETKAGRESQQESELANYYFVQVMSAAQMLGPLSPKSLDAVRYVRDLIPLFRKLSGFVSSLRGAFSRLAGFSNHGWSWGIADGVITAQNSTSSLRIPFLAFLSGSLVGVDFSSRRETGTAEFQSICKKLSQTYKPFGAFPVAELVAMTRDLD